MLDRRAAITALVRKYAGPGEGLAGVLAWAEDAERRLSELDVSDEALEALAAARDAARAEVDELGGRGLGRAGAPPPTGSPPRSAPSSPGWR